MKVEAKALCPFLFLLLFFFSAVFITESKGKKSKIKSIIANTVELSLLFTSSVLGLIIAVYLLLLLSVFLQIGSSDASSFWKELLINGNVVYPNREIMEVELNGKKDFILPLSNEKIEVVKGKLRVILEENGGMNIIEGYLPDRCNLFYKGKWLKEKPQINPTLLDINNNNNNNNNTFNTFLLCLE